MDGNGRWALKKKLKRSEGHKAGIKTCIKLLKSLRKIDFKILELSFFVFSTENWKRPITEIRDLFNLIEIYYQEFEKVANDNNLRIRHFGSRRKISKKILTIIDDVSHKTKKIKGHV